MKLFSKKSVTMVLALTMLLAVEAGAGNPLRKLGRGIINVGFGCCEIPKKVYYMNHEEGGLAAISYGTLLGITYCLAREGVGIIDIVTFPVPLPGCTDDPRDAGWGYGPIMRPEWIFAPQENPYNIIYSDAAVVN